jgi:hypothetical protein
MSIVTSTTVVLLALSLTGLREDDAVVSYFGRFAPAAACPLASWKGGEPATELTLIALEHHERGRYSPVTGPALKGCLSGKTPSSAVDGHADGVEVASEQAF